MTKTGRCQTKYSGQARPSSAKQGRTGPIGGGSFSGKGNRDREGGWRHGKSETTADWL